MVLQLFSNRQTDINIATESVQVQHLKIIQHNWSRRLSLKHKNAASNYKHMGNGYITSWIYYNKIHFNMYISNHIIYNKLKQNNDLIIIKCTDFNVIDDTL